MEMDTILKVNYINYNKFLQDNPNTNLLEFATNYPDTLELIDSYNAAFEELDLKLTWEINKPILTITGFKDLKQVQEVIDFSTQDLDLGNGQVLKNLITCRLAKLRFINN